MSASRSGETGALCSARFWSSLFCAALMPTSIGYQDIAALIAREQAPLSQWHLIVSPVQAATFSYSRSIGSVIPQPLGLQTVNFDPRALDAYSWKIDEPIHTRPARQIEYPSVERSHKADRLPAISRKIAQNKIVRHKPTQSVKTLLAGPISKQIKLVALAIKLARC